MSEPARYGRSLRGTRAHVLGSVRRFPPRPFVSAHDVYVWACGNGSNRAGIEILEAEWFAAVADGSACTACRRVLEHGRSAAYRDYGRALA